MKTTIMVASVTMLVAAIALASGVDANPIQAVFALPFFGVAFWFYKIHERMDAREKRGRRNKDVGRKQVYDYQRGAFTSAA